MSGQGHHWGPGQVIVSWAPCDCPTADADPGCGHLVIHCRQSRCDATEMTQTGAPLGAGQEGGRPAGADGDGSRATGLPGTAWTLLVQAHEHHKRLLKPSHPSAADIAGLYSWIRGCVEAVDEARRLEALIGRSAEIARVEGLAARVTAVVDAFQMYADMLERFRRIQPPEMPSPAASRPLAAVADDERVLLGCRGALRRSLQQLIAALQADNASRTAMVRPGKLA